MTTESTALLAIVDVDNSAWFEFKRDNDAKRYGYGYECQAKAYMDYLNEGLDFNLWWPRRLSGEEVAELRLDDNTDLGFNLDDELRAIENMW